MFFFTTEHTDAIENRVETNLVTGAVIGAAIAIHRALGPGLLESAYRPCMVHELRLQGLHVEVERPLALVYRGLVVDRAYKIDLVVEEKVVVELKAISKLDRVHEAQILSYMKLSGIHTGLLINFHVPTLISGVRRFVL